MIKYCASLNGEYSKNQLFNTKEDCITAAIQDLVLLRTRLKSDSQVFNQNYSPDEDYVEFALLEVKEDPIISANQVGIDCVDKINELVLEYSPYFTDASANKFHNDLDEFVQDWFTINKPRVAHTTVTHIKYIDIGEYLLDAKDDLAELFVDDYIGAVLMKYRQNNPFK